MKTKNYGLYAVAVAIAAGGALWAGLPLSALFVIVAVLACPLMMVMMHGGHGGGVHGGRDDHGQPGRHPIGEDAPKGRTPRP